MIVLAYYILGLATRVIYLSFTSTEVLRSTITRVVRETFVCEYGSGFFCPEKLLAVRRSSHTAVLFLTAKSNLSVFLLCLVLLCNYGQSDTTKSHPHL